MKLKNEILMNENLTKTLNEWVTYKIPPTKAFTLLKLLKVFMKEKQDLDEARNNLIKKYGTEDNGNFSINQTDKEAIEKFGKDFREILELEFEIGTEKIKMDWDNIKDSNNNLVLLSVGDISILEPIFDFE